MATATITIQLPTTRTDGTAFDASNYGGAHVFRNGEKVGTVAAPALVFTDQLASPGSYSYAVTVFDTQPVAAESGQSLPVAVTVAAPLAAPSAPTITVTLS